MRNHPILTLLILLFCFPAGIVFAAGTDPDMAAPIREGGPAVTKSLKAADMIDPSSFYVDEKLFASSLPLLVFEFEGGDALAGDLSARLTVYDSNSGDNSLADVPASTTLINLQEKRDSSRGKTTYALALAGADSPAPPEALALAGLPSGRQWLLRGSTRDKGMLRNGLAYELGRYLMPEATPESRFCEVLFRLNGAYRYEGLHLLTQSTEDIYRKLAAPGKDGVLLRYATGRARQADNLVRVGHKFFLPTPLWSDEPLTPEEIREISGQLEKLESVLQSVSPRAFLAYSQQLDEESAIGFFLLNIMMLNVSDDVVPFALLKNKDGKFQFIPDWDFDNSIDNELERTRPLPYDRGKVVVEPLSVLSRRPPVWTILGEGGSIGDLRIYPFYRALEGDKFIWMDRFFLSRPYLSGLYATYTRCREEHFSPTKLLGLVDVLALRLGHAVERDWLRWAEEYTGAAGPKLRPFEDAQGLSHDRQTTTFDQELVKIAHCLKKQNDFLGQNIENLYWMSADLYAKEKTGNKQAGYSLITLVVIALIIFLLTRKL